MLAAVLGGSAVWELAAAPAPGHYGSDAGGYSLIDPPPGDELLAFALPN